MSNLTAQVRQAWPKDPDDGKQPWPTALLLCNEVERLEAELEAARAGVGELHQAVLNSERDNLDYVGQLKALSAENERYEDSMRADLLLLDAHFLLPSGVSAENRLRQLRQEIADRLGDRSEAVSDNYRLYEANDSLRAERDAAQRENERLTADSMGDNERCLELMRKLDEARTENRQLAHAIEVMDLEMLMDERLRVREAERDGLRGDLLDLKAALEAEVERLDPRHDGNLFGGGWRKKAWNDGVRTARAVSHQNLSALLARVDGALDGASRPPEVDGSEHREPQGEGT